MKILVSNIIKLPISVSRGKCGNEHCVKSGHFYNTHKDAAFCHKCTGQTTGLIRLSAKKICIIALR